MTTATDTQWVARIPRRVVIHRMETADCLDSRIFWGIILWSLCGPQPSKHFVVKDSKGFIQKDANGVPIPGRLKDLLSLLGLAPGMKAHVSRAIQRLKEKNSLRSEGNLLYIEEAPPPVESPNAVAKLGNWNVAGIVVKLGNLPADPIARASSIQWLNELKLGYNGSIKTLKTGYRELLRQGISEGRIIIGLDEKKRRGETATAATEESVKPGPPPEPAAAADISPIEPEAEQVKAALEPHGSTDLDTARRIIARSRQHFPEATVQDILLMAEEKARSITASTRNPIAFLVEVIPKGFEGYTRQKERTRPAAVMELQTCVRCHREIEAGAGVYQGQCAECFTGEIPDG